MVSMWLMAIFQHTPKCLRLKPLIAQGGVTNILKELSSRPFIRGTSGLA